MALGGSLVLSCFNLGIQDGADDSRTGDLVPDRRLPSIEPLYSLRMTRERAERIDRTSARIVLIDSSNKFLGTFSDDLSEGAKKRLVKLDVEVHLGHGLDHIDEDGLSGPPGWLHRSRAGG